MPGRLLSTVIAISMLVAACGVAETRAAAEGAPATSTSLPTTAATTAPPTTTVAPTTTTTTAPTTTTTTLPPKPPIVLGFAGDTSFTHGLDARDPLGDVTAELSSPDMMFVNLETTVAEPDVGTRVDKTYTFKSPPASVGILRDAGIDVVQLANNHILDFQRPALLRTIELLDEGGIAHAGAGADPAAAYAPTFIDVDGWRLGLVAFSHIPCGWSASGENTRPEVAWACEPFVVDTIDAVKEAAAEADIVIVMVHWGIELDHCPQSYQTDLAIAWERVGADLIVGGHPHVLQGVGRIGDAWLVNSTGNFAFPSARQASARSAMFEFTLTDEGIDLRAIPIRITNGRPAAATGDDAASIMNDLSRWSFGYTFDEAGVALPTEEPGACG